MKKVSPGDDFIMSAHTYNNFVDLVSDKDKEKSKKYNIQKRNEVQIINASGIDLPIFSIVEYSSNFDPFIDENLITYKIDKVDVPDLVSDGVANYLPATNKKRVCILQEPIENNGVGTALIKGIAKVKLKQESGLNTSKPMRVIKVKDDGDALTSPPEYTYMKVTNKETPDDLLWHNSAYTYGVIHLGKYQVNPPPFVGILDCIVDGVNTFKIVVKNYYNGRVYHIRGSTVSTFRNLTMKPPRPRSVAVLAQYVYASGGLDFVEIQPFFSSDLESVVKYDDAQTILNNTILGRRSYKDVIGTVNFADPIADAMWYGEYPL